MEHIGRMWKPFVAKRCDHPIDIESCNSNCETIDMEYSIEGRFLYMRIPESTTTATIPLILALPGMSDEQVR